MYLRKLSSGLWQATVRMPNGRKITATDPLKKVVRRWGQDQEAAFARGEVRDPRAGEIRVSQWRDRIEAARGPRPSRQRDDSVWRTHCEPRWGDWPMNAVTRSEAQAWVNTLLETPSRRQPKDADEDEVVFLSGATVRAVASLMRTLYASAVKESPPIVLTNPFADLSLPPASSQTLTWFEHDEVTALLEAVKDDAMAATLFELGCTTGLRVGELLALRGDRVDWLRGRVSVVDVQTKAGLKTWPKTDRSRRTVPVPNELLKRMSKLMEGRPRESLVFTAPRGGALDVDNLRERLWYPAVEKAGVRRYPPRAMRHTAASHLVMDGVPLIDVRDLLGHTSIRVTERYAHLRPDAHEKVVQSWARRSS